MHAEPRSHTPPASGPVELERSPAQLADELIRWFVTGVINRLSVAFAAAAAVWLLILATYLGA